MVPLNTFDKYRNARGFSVLLILSVNRMEWPASVYALSIV